VTERKRVEESLRLAARRDTFRLRLADTLRLLSDPEAIQTEAARAVGTVLGASRAFFAEADPAGQHLVVRQDFHEGVPSAAGPYRPEDFGEEVADALRGGRTMIVDDVATRPGVSDAQRAA